MIKKENLITLFSETKDSQFLDLIKNINMLKEFDICTQHIVFKKGLDINIPEDVNNIIVIEIDTVTDVIKSNLSLLDIYRFKNIIIISLENTKMDTLFKDTIDLKYKVSTRGISFCPREWGGVAEYFTSGESGWVIEMLVKFLERISNEKSSNYTS